jgi:hypothetical protein
MPFTRTPSLQGIDKDDPNWRRSARFCPERQSSDGARKNNETSTPSPLATRDVKRLLRMERALQHVPLDVELARIVGTGRFPA